MAERAVGAAERPDDTSRAILTDGERAVFRSAGLWMGVLGGIELVAGSLAGAAWLFVVLGGAPGQVPGSSPIDYVVTPLSVVVSIGVGVLTLLAARSFHRAGRTPGAGLPAVTAAVADLRELYERQVWVVAGLLAVVIGTAFVVR